MIRFRIRTSYTEVQFENPIEKPMDIEVLETYLEQALETDNRIRSGSLIPYSFISMKESLIGLVRIVHKGLIEVVTTAKRSEKLALVVYAFDPLPVPLRTICMCIREKVSVIRNYITNEPYREYFVRDQYDLVSLTKAGAEWVLEEILPRFDTAANSDT